MGERVAGVGLLLVLAGWLLPNHYPPWVSFHLEAASFAGFVLLAAATLLRQPGRVQLPPLAAAMLLVAAIPWIQWLAGLLGFSGDAWAVTAYLMAATCAWATGYLSERRGNGPSAAVWLMAAISVAALVSSVIALLQWLGWDEQGLFVMTLTPGDRIGGNMAQANHLGSLIVMGLVGLLFAYERRQLAPPLLAFASAVLVAGLCATDSRSAIVSFLTVACWWLLRQRDCGFRFKRLQLAVFSVLVLGAFFLWAPLSEALLLTPGRGVAVTSSNGRFEIWGQLLHALGNSPVWGYGWLQTAAAQGSVAPSMPIALGFISSYSHNLLLDLLLWNGLPIGGLILMAAIWLLWRSVPNIRSRDAVLFVAAVLPVAVHSMFEFPFAYAYFLLPAALLTGAAAAHLPVGRLVALPTTLCWAIVLGTGGICAAIGIEYLRMEEDFRVVRFQSMRIGSAEAGFQATPAVFNSQLGAMLAMGLAQARPGMPQAELTQWSKVARRYPWQALMFKHTVALALNGRPNEAAQMLLLLKALHGAKVHEQARRDLQRLQETEHPQLRVPQAR